MSDMNTTTTAKPNRHPGTCVDCRKRLAAGEGFLLGKSHRNAPWEIACSIDHSCIVSTPEPSPADVTRGRFQAMLDISHGDARRAFGIYAAECEWWDGEPEITASAKVHFLRTLGLDATEALRERDEARAHEEALMAKMGY